MKEMFKERGTGEEKKIYKSRDNNMNFSYQFFFTFFYFFILSVVKVDFNLSLRFEPSNA